MYELWGKLTSEIRTKPNSFFTMRMMARKAYIPNMIKKMIDDGSLQTLIRGSWCEKEIFSALKISAPRWYALKKEIPELRELINCTLKSRGQLFLEVKGAMFQKATGFYVTEKSKEERFFPDGKLCYTTIREKERYIVPDLGAMKLIMGNLARLERMGENPDPEIASWSNNPDPVTIKTEESFNIESVLDNDIKALIDSITIEQKEHLSSS